MLDNFAHLKMNFDETPVFRVPSKTTKKEIREQTLKTGEEIMRLKKSVRISAHFVHPDVGCSSLKTLKISE